MFVQSPAAYSCGGEVHSHPRRVRRQRKWSTSAPPSLCSFVPVREILQRKLTRLTEEDIRFLVESNAKKRFTLKEMDGKLWIAAVQGHSDALGLGTEHLRRITT
eukprot:Sspe_Gene.17146::Locus_6075_Transcript_1_5_Confidence_0.643_Length_484::g.17146::m.17146